MGTLSKMVGDDGKLVDVLQLLAEQHEEVDALIEKIEQGEGERVALFAELADKLAAHAAAEEQIFYPFVMAKDTSTMLHEAVEEHLAVKRVLADLMMKELSDEEFLAKLSVLKEQVSHHAHEEEEGKLFPKLEEMLSAEERAGLGNEVLARYAVLLENGVAAGGVPGETEQAAPLPSPR